MKKNCCVMCGKYRKFKNPELFAVSVVMMMKQDFKKRNQLRYYKFLV